VQKDEDAGDDMATGHRDGSGREEGDWMDRKVEDFGNRKALKDATDRMMMIYYFVLCE
jgi:hypothetical protein